MSARLAYGPNRSTTTVAGVLPRPVTFSVSKISSPGLTTAFDTTVVTFGAARAIVVSLTSAQAVVTAAMDSLSAMPSRYV